MSSQNRSTVVTKDSYIKLPTLKEIDSNNEKLARRRAVYKLFLQGLDPHEIAKLLTKKNQDKGVKAIVTENRVRRDIEIMRGQVRGKAVDTDSWDEVGEHCAYFEEMSRLAAWIASNGCKNVKEIADMMRVSMTAREGLIRLQKDVGIIQYATPNDPSNVIRMPRSDEPADITKMSTEQLRELAELMGEDPEIAELAAELESEAGPEPFLEGEDPEEPPVDATE